MQRGTTSFRFAIEAGSGVSSFSSIAVISTTSSMKTRLRLGDAFSARSLVRLVALLVPS